MRDFRDARDFYGWLSAPSEADGEIPARTERAWRRHEAMRRIRGGAAVDPVTGYPLHGPGGQVLPPERGLEVHQEVVGPAPDLIPGGPAPRTRPVLGPDYASAMAEAEAAGVNTRGFRAALERRVREGRVNPAWGESEDEPLFLPPLSEGDADALGMTPPQATGSQFEMDQAPSPWGEAAGEIGPRLRGGFDGIRDRGYGLGAQGPVGAAPTERRGLLDVGPDLQPLRGRTPARGVAPATGRMSALSGAPDGPGEAPLPGTPGGWLSPPMQSRIDPAGLPRTAAHMRRVSQALGGDASGYGGSLGPNHYALPFEHGGVSGQAEVFGARGAEVFDGGSGADRVPLRASGGPVRRLPLGSAGAWPGPIGDPGERSMRGGLATGFAAANGAAGQWDGPPLRGKQRPQPASPADAGQLGPRQSLPAHGAFPNTTEGPSVNGSGASQRPFSLWPVPGYAEPNQKDKPGEGDANYGPTRKDRNGRTKTHWGIDIQAPEGTPAVAVADGRVIDMGPYNYSPKGFGRQVVIDHGIHNGKRLYTIYAHLVNKEGDYVEPGTIVRAGQKIGSVGRTGGVPGDAHLHFEVRVGGSEARDIGHGRRQRSPLEYLPPQASKAWRP